MATTATRRASGMNSAAANDGLARQLLDEQDFEELQTRGVPKEHVDMVAEYLSKHAEELYQWSLHVTPSPDSPKQPLGPMSARSVWRLTRDSVW
jgi:hypothetical protein